MCLKKIRKLGRAGKRGYIQASVSDLDARKQIVTKMQKHP